MHLINVLMHISAIKMSNSYDGRGLMWNRMIRMQDYQLHTVFAQTFLDFQQSLVISNQNWIIVYKIP